MKSILPLFAILAIAASSPLSSLKPHSKDLPVKFAPSSSNRSSADVPNGTIPEWLYYASQWMTCTKKPLRCTGRCESDIRCTHPDLLAEHADLFQPRVTNLETFLTVVATPSTSSVATSQPAVIADSTPQLLENDSGEENSPQWRGPGKVHWAKPNPEDDEFGAWTGPQIFGPDLGYTSDISVRNEAARPGSSSAPSSGPLPAASTTLKSATTPPLHAKPKKSSCALQHCASNSQCGAGAKCTLGYCACKPDYKSITSSKSALSGRHDFLPDLSAVFVDTDVECGKKCSKVGCREVATAGVAGCFSSSGGGTQGTQGKAKEDDVLMGDIAANSNDSSVVLPKKKGSGVVQKPSADIGGT